MHTDVPDTPIELSDTVAPYGSPVYYAGCKTRLRRQIWLFRGLSLAGFMTFGVIVVFADANLYLYVLPTMLFVLGWLYAEFWDWPRMKFCPSCEALTCRPKWRIRLTFCANCGRLVDPAKFLIGTPGTFDLSDERNNDGREPIVKLLALVFLVAFKDRASEVRFEPGADDYRLSYRCDGVRYDMVPPPLHLHRAISDTLKALTGLSLETVDKQSGKLQIRVEDHAADATVEVVPAAVGENVVVLLSNAQQAS